MSKLETVILDFTTINCADDGNTSHYGGYWNIKGTVNGTQVDQDFDGYGNDRGDTHHDDIISNLMKLGIIIPHEKLEELSDTLRIESVYVLHLEDGVLREYEEQDEYTDKTEIVLTFPEKITGKNLEGLMQAIIAQCDEDGDDYELKTTCGVILNGEVWR